VKGDAYLEDRLTQYDTWLQEGRIPFSSKVIPVHEALDVKQWVLPTEQVIEFLHSARSYALTRCTCRSHYQRCDNPLEVCFLLDNAADQAVADRTARYVSLEEAMRILRQANERGLVHLTIYKPEQTWMNCIRVYAVCSCCSCCCHDLQFLRLYGRSDLIARSEYVAQTDMEACTQCGACVQRCVFGARLWQDGRLSYDVGACYGCGLCVTVCPVDAIVLKPKSLTVSR
jgi:Pyruvate/2-oxoacid:ferredoxin oxidoreductase delta subunit